VALGGGAMAGMARVVLRADTAQFNRELGESQQRFHRATSGMDADLSKLGRGALAGSGIFQGLGRSIAFASGAFLGAAGFSAAIRAGYDELAQAAKVGAQTNAVLKSTGEIAGVTARHVDELAASLLKKTGVDDEVIKSGENLLLTFTNVRNVAGENNDVFDQATRLSLDLSVAMGRDLNESVLQVGKALQDPIRGVTALRRVGVAFTEAQRVQIKHLVETNHTLDAQKIILQELQKEFGGSAEAAGKTLPGQINILRETVRNLEGDLLRGTLPAIEKLVHSLTGWLSQTRNQQRLQRDANQAIQAASDIIETMVPIVQGAVDAVGGLKNMMELLIGLKVAAVLGGWSGAISKLIGAEAAAGAGAGAGLLGASSAAAALRAGLRSMPTKIAIALSIKLIDDATGHKITRFNTWFYNNVVRPATKGLTLGQFDPGAGGTESSGGPSGATGAIANTAAGKVVGYAKAWGAGSGVTYTWGGVSPQTGFDCSGYLMAAYASAGIKIPHNTVAQFNDPHAIHVPPGQEQPGDGIYYASPGAPGAAPRHVGIFIGNNQVIEYYSRGKPAKIIPLRGPGARGDYMGARRWLKVQSGSTSPGGGAEPPPGGGTPPKAPPATQMPAGMRLALGEAEQRKDVAGQIKILSDWEKLLEQRKAKAKTLAQKADIQDEINQVLGKLGALRKKKTPKPGPGPATMPEEIRLRYEEAIASGSIEDQIAILTEWDKLLEKRKKAAKKLVDKADIQAEINSVVAQLKGLRTGEADKAAKAADAALAKTIAGIEQLSSALTAEVARASRGGSATRDITDSAGKVVSREFVGAASVQFDPKTQQWTTATLKPDVDAMRKELDHILKVVLPGLNAKLVAEQKTWARLRQHPNKNASALKRQVDVIGALMSAKDNAIALATDLATSITELEGALKLEPNKEEAAAGPGAADLPGELRYQAALAAGTPGLGDDLNVLGQESALYSSRLANPNLSLEDRISLTEAYNNVQGQIAQTRTSYLTDIPGDLRLRQAQAAGTPTLTDDQMVLRQLRDLTASRLAEADTIEAQITLTERLTDLNRQLNDQRAQENAEVIAFLSNVRGLRAFQSNVYDPGAALRGTTINVNNTFTQAEGDPHLYSQALAFELRAVI
jgi:cell wall-associated NlpC family hydrolase